MTISISEKKARSTLPHLQVIIERYRVCSTEPTKITNSFEDSLPGRSVMVNEENTSCPRKLQLGCRAR